MKIPEFKDISAASRQVATKSAMNPILWVCAIATPISLVMSAFSSPPLSYALLAIGAIPLLVACWIFVHFAFGDPDRLQSESHIEQMEMLTRIGKNGSQSQITISGGNTTGNVGLISGPDDGGSA